MRYNELFCEVMKHMFRYTFLKMFLKSSQPALLELQSVKFLYATFSVVSSEVGE